MADFFDKTFLAFAVAFAVADVVTKRLCAWYAAVLFATELAHFESNKRKEYALDKANPYSGRLFLSLVIFMAQVLIAVALSRVLHAVLGVPRVYAGALLFGVIVIVTALAELAIARKATRRSLRQLLKEQGMLVCTGCAYDLRGQVEHRCPECGRPFKGRRVRQKSAPGSL